MALLASLKENLGAADLPETFICHFEKIVTGVVPNSRR
jgi:hypothetical protein